MGKKGGKERCREAKKVLQREVEDVRNKVVPRIWATLDSLADVPIICTYQLYAPPPPLLGNGEDIVGILHPLSNFPIATGATSAAKSRS